LAIYEDIESILEIPDLDKAKLAGEVYTRSHQQDNHQRQFAYDRKTGIPCNVGGKFPHPVCQLLKYSTYAAYQFIHTQIPSFLLVFAILKTYVQIFITLLYYFITRHCFKQWGVPERHTYFCEGLLAFVALNG
jgi:hypothetical protein